MGDREREREVENASDLFHSEIEKNPHFVIVKKKNLNLFEIYTLKLPSFYSYPGFIFSSETFSVSLSLFFNIFLPLYFFLNLSLSFLILYLPFFDFSLVLISVFLFYIYFHNSLSRSSISLSSFVYLPLSL